MFRVSRRFTVLFGLAVVAPTFVAAQPPAGAPPGHAGPAGGAMPMMAPQGHPGAQAPQAHRMPPMFATRVLNARRALDLTPRQVAQLDSIERVQFAEHKQIAGQVRATHDSMVARGEAGAHAAMSPDSMRARMARMHPQMEQQHKRDSLTRVAVEKLLTDAQRQKLKEIAAFERGRQQGLRQGRMGHGARRGHGMPGGMPEAMHHGKPGEMTPGSPMSGGMAHPGHAPTPPAQPPAPPVAPRRPDASRN